jgi:prophage regulatory protein
MSKLLSEGDGSKPRRMLNEKQVLAIVPVGRSTLWRMEKAGKFPKAKHIASDRRIWFEDEVIAWQYGLNDAGYVCRPRGKSK